MSHAENIFPFEKQSKHSANQNDPMAKGKQGIKGKAGEQTGERNDFFKSET